MTLPEQLDRELTLLAGTCPVAEALDTWPDTAWLASVLADPGVPSAALSAAVRDLTPRLGAQAIREHRQGDCPCIIGGGL